MVTKTEKPSVPKKVYKEGYLCYTIINYLWVNEELAKKSNGFLKIGWFPIIKYNKEHPYLKAIDKFCKDFDNAIMQESARWKFYDKYLAKP